MTKIDIFSGFLGAGKTTLIKKLIAEAFTGEKLVLIENEFGEIAVDGGFLQDEGIEITEMSQGCICCSLVGDFGKALREVLEKYHPDRILIEPSGVGKLSDVIRAVQNLQMEDVLLNSFTTVADAGKIKVYMKNFGEFYNDQIEHANCVILSRTQNLSQEKLDKAAKLLREKNAAATIIVAPWDQLEGAQILAAMEHKGTMEEELAELAKETEDHHHHHHHEDGECCCGHHHDDEHEHEHHHHDHEHHHHEHEHEHDHEHDHEHHHHHEDGECCCGHHHDDEEHEHHHHEHEHDHEHDHEHEHEHEHHHHYDENGVCSCGHHHDDEGHEHHHHHHADEIFGSWGQETTRKYTQDEIREILAKLEDEETYGIVLRAKGIVSAPDGTWIHFDYVPEETDIRTGSAIVMGRLCVIGSHIKEEALKALFA